MPVNSSNCAISEKSSLSSGESTHFIRFYLFSVPYSRKYRSKDACFFRENRYSVDTMTKEVFP